MKKRTIENKNLKKLFPTSLIKQYNIPGVSNGMNKAPKLIRWPMGERERSLKKIKK
jgi:hypothetical protein